jgi:hypothetical protein
MIPDDPQHARLTTALDAALAAPAWPMTQQWASTSLREDLEAAVARHAGLQPIVNQMLHVPGHGQRMEPFHLATWLVNRARTVGRDGAISEALHAATAASVNALRIVAVAGPVPDAPLELGNNMSLVPFALVPESELKTRLSSGPRLETLHLPHVAPTAALLEQEMIDGDSYRGTSAPQAYDLQALFDTVRVLTAVGPSAPVVLAVWSQMADDVPWPLGAGYTQPIHEILRTRNTPMTPQLAAQASDLISRFRQAGEGTRARLRLALDRLNRAQRRENHADAAIDLGIALEPIYTDKGERDELKYKLQVRAARYLGESDGERREIFDDMGFIYALRSAAAHEGRVREHVGKKKQPTKEVLERGFALAARSIIKVLQTGEPDWSKIVTD